ncbi:conserved hypothetical protein [Theileria equi strain WA]|uniref:BPL/LPL catalytic domain-containing protein n=1 Tax=Theileria equi strain WA TaxID=1537102 RepID=L1LAJ6_THEEQ|nr:conserved hypothetical protein [Theileria equi strain WA]EKX72188.1 conserved hypothetical protein [Theileria equi strain WA]|eukprot:XP_004831640.1 conserved hypothetical protein [Theileria equi strain WA]
MKSLSDLLAVISAEKRRLCYVFNLDGLGIFKQLQFEEFLYRRATSVSKNCAFLLVNNLARTEKSSIILGLSGKPGDFIRDIQLCRRENVEVIKRFTGGGTVVVDKNIVISSIIATHEWMNGYVNRHAGAGAYGGVASSADPKTPNMPVISQWLVDAIYRKSGIFNSRFGLLDGDFVVESPLSQFKGSESAKVQVESPENNSVHYKVGGNAQACSTSAFVYHTSFLWSISPNISRLLVKPKRRPKYRGERDHGEFLKSVQLGLSNEYRDSGKFANALRGMVDDYRLVEIEGDSRNEEEVTDKNHPQRLIIRGNVIDEAIESMDKLSTVLLDI